MAVLTADTGAIANTETEVIGYAIPANTVAAVDTTATTLLQLTFVSGNAANAYTFQHAVIQKISTN